MHAVDLCAVAMQFIRARRTGRMSREALEGLSRQRLAAFLDRDVRRFSALAPYAGRPLAEFPIMDKHSMLAAFHGFNRYGLGLDRAYALARSAEASRDFSDTLDGAVVGLSSGTTGSPGVFLVSRRECALWVGVVLARVLSSAALAQMFTPWKPRLRVAFFLRATSRLYESVASRRLEFRYFDLMRWDDEKTPIALAHYRPHVLVAPASVLAGLAADRRVAAGINPMQDVSVAEVLEPEDAALVQQRLGVRPDIVYQATEGMLGYTCAQGRLHLNEAFLHVQPEWLDLEQRRFLPIITDFSRTTQAVVRYRLDDVLVHAGFSCPCGSPERTILRVEGRADEVLLVTGQDGTPVRLFPDVVRRSMACCVPPPDDYRLAWDGETLLASLRVPPGVAGEAVHAAVASALDNLWSSAGARAPRLRLVGWMPRRPEE